MIIEGEITAERESWLSFLEGMLTKRESDLVIIEIRKFSTFRKILRDLKRNRLVVLQDIWAMTWDFQQCGVCDQQRLRPACAYVQSDQSIC